MKNNVVVMAMKNNVVVIPYRCLLETVPRICPANCLKYQYCGSILVFSDEEPYLLDPKNIDKSKSEFVPRVYNEEINKIALPFRMAMKLGAL